MIAQIMTLIWILIKIIIIIIPLLVAVAFATVLERKVVGFMQCRIGPNRVGLKGVGQPLADTLKLIFKEIIIPRASNHYLFMIAPILSLAPALAAWSVIPFNLGWVVANIHAGVLFLFSITSLGVYGVLVAGWASNSKYSLLGALRSAAQMISYEIAMGFVLVGVLVAAGTMNLQEIVLRQQGGIWHWYALPLLPLLVTYGICALAETNRVPFDVAEGEAELVAGFHVEYSGMAFALFFLAEYANMILVSAIVSLLFFGGWLSPFSGIPILGELFAWVPGIFWFFIKISFFLFLYFWIRATFPRYRYDQIMYLGWKVLIPVTLVWLFVVAFAVEYKIGPWFH